MFQQISDAMNNIEDLVNQIKEKKPKKVLLQLPEGLKTKAVEIAQAIENQGIEVIIYANPCYGACDLPLDNYECDLIVHVGHTKFYKNIETRVPVLYFPWEIEINEKELADIDFSLIKEKKIGLITTTQHLPSLEIVSDMLKKAGKEPVTGGQILGCWTENVGKLKGKVEAFLFIGSGRFHPLAVKEKTYILDLEKKRIELSDQSYLEKRRYANIFHASKSKKFAILVSTKPGQENLEQAVKIRQKLKEKDKKASILIMNEISNESLLGIEADAFINTACPRIVEDKFSKPIINANDIEEIFKVL